MTIILETEIILPHNMLEQIIGNSLSDVDFVEVLRCGIWSHLI